MNGVFSVLFKERCQSVLCVMSESFLFACFNLYRFAKSFKGSFLATFLESRFSTRNIMELVVCRSLLKSPKTDSFCKYKICLRWISYGAEELLFSSSVFWIAQTLYLPTGLLVAKSPLPAPGFENFLKAENLSKNPKQQLKGGTHLELAREKGLLIELNCHWCTVQLGRPVTIPRATTWGVLWSGPVGDFRG